MAKLVCRSGPDAGHEYPLEDKRVLFGRQSTCSHQVRDPKASREHFAVNRVGELFTVSDLRSRNGTRVNDRRINEHLLDDNDVIAVGKCEYVFVLEADDKRLSDLITKYDIGERIGAGGMGIVFNATQRSMDRNIALKMLAPKFSNKPRFIDQFIKEARAAGALNHPNIIQVHDVGTENNVHYFSMELVDGDTCLALLKKNGAFPADQAVEIIRQTAKALEYAHNQRIIHRDIKPENIMLTHNGAVKLADLGISKTFDELDNESEQKVVGTPHYIAPEVASGKKFDHRLDLYSLGATFYHLATGDTPYHGSTPGEILRAHVKEPVPNPTEIVPTLPLEVSAMIQRMMAKDPEDRFASTSELVEEIEHLQESGALRSGTGGEHETMLLRNLASGEAAGAGPTTHGTVSATGALGNSTSVTGDQYRTRQRSKSNVVPFIVIFILIAAGLFAAVKFTEADDSDSSAATEENTNDQTTDETSAENADNDTATETTGSPEVTPDVAEPRIDPALESEQYAQMTKLFTDLEQAKTAADIQDIKRAADALRSAAVSPKVQAELVDLDTQIQTRNDTIMSNFAEKEFTRIEPAINDLLKSHNYDQAQKLLGNYLKQHNKHAAHKAKLLERDINQRSKSFIFAIERKLGQFQKRKDLESLRQLRKELPASMLESDIAKQINQAIGTISKELHQEHQQALSEIKEALFELGTSRSRRTLYRARR